MKEDGQDFNEVIRTIRKDDPRYARGAYHFVRQALDHTIKDLHRQGELSGSSHVSGPQLLQGIREFALEQFGPMSKTVFNEWGVSETRDFGNIVFNLVECNVLGKTEGDKPEDFDAGFDFDAAFEEPFRPGGRPRRRA